MTSNNKLTRLEKSTKIMNESKTLRWCYVDTENTFTFRGKTYVIDNSVTEYKVYNKAGTTYDYTNEAYMEQVLATIDNNDNLVFYNQNYDLIKDGLVYLS